ncbi:MAG: hypothetical protein Q8M02_00665 [Candidatus Didemnitutus sp.]|nr:hypothetical protein [Candidatus Didemnitutus sp.]
MLRDTFRRWADQWPDESRWILWVWGIFTLVLLVIGGALFWQWRHSEPDERTRATAAESPIGRDFTVPVVNAPNGLVQARRVAQAFPAEPELWVAAAHLVRWSDNSAAAQLLRDALVLLPAATAPWETGLALRWAQGDRDGARAQLARSRPSALDSVEAQLIAQLLGDKPAEVTIRGHGPTRVALSAELQRAALKLLSHYPKEPPPAAARTLERLAESSAPESLEVVRLLALWSGDPRTALRWTEAWAARQGRLDSLLHLATLQLVNGQSTSETEARLAAFATNGTDDALAYLDWLIVQGRLVDAQRWLDRVPPALRDDGRFALREVALLVATGKRQELRRRLAGGGWGPIKPEILELAFAARLASEREQTVLARELWRVALVAAGSERSAQQVLLRMAVSLELRDVAWQSFERVLALPGDNRPTARQFALWARHQGNAGLGQRARQAWRELEPAAEAAYFADTGEKREAGPNTP